MFAIKILVKMAILKKILLIDDDPLIRKAYTQDLEEKGYFVSSAGDAKSAFALLKENFYDLVLTDLRMPDITGLEVLEKVKANSSLCLVIIMTSYGDLQSAIKALQLGADDYILKSESTHELLIRLKRCFEKQDLQKKIQVYESIIPVCCVCGIIRDDSGREKNQWLSMEEYITKNSSARISHTYCPECYAKARKEENLDD